MSVRENLLNIGDDTSLPVYQCITCKLLFSSQFFLKKHLNQTNHWTCDNKEIVKLYQKKAKNVNIITTSTTTTPFTEKRTSSKLVKSRLSSYACSTSTINNTNHEMKQQSSAQSIITNSIPSFSLMIPETFLLNRQNNCLYFASHSELNQAKAAYVYVIIDRHNFLRQSVEIPICDIMNPRMAGTVIAENSFLISQYSLNSIQPEFEALCQGLYKATELNIQNITVFCDSELLFNHLMCGCQTPRYETLGYLNCYIEQLFKCFQHVHMQLVSKHENVFLAQMVQSAYFKTNLSF